ncbi:hypothetical protein Slin15195_G044670 [Septoria linicola]|uniref:Uncharacterized protein n=1 Tax=Septoria linicola TaxID=215465 RepID=A0A9Q9AS53_9PEZI|nr:hypothetical protein Slin14017_G048190 [Septoria linicola]USW51148.1 hypothetical protein Slin15195_G044670 [Septoria linicola]
MSISDNNMNGESHSVRVPELSGPIHQSRHTSAITGSERDLTISEAETFPTWSAGRSTTSTRTDEQELHGSASRDSATSNEGGLNTRSVAYADDTNTEPAGLSAYDHGKDLSTTATPSSSRSRSRSRGAYDTHRASQDGGTPWADDKEAKQKKFLGKLLEHKLAPSFLK